VTKSQGLFENLKLRREEEKLCERAALIYTGSSELILVQTAPPGFLSQAQEGQSARASQYTSEEGKQEGCRQERWFYRQVERLSHMSRQGPVRGP